MAAKPAPSDKSATTNGKAPKATRPARAAARPAKKAKFTVSARKVAKKVVTRPTPPARQLPPKAPEVQKAPRPKASNTLQVYEAALEAMHAEDYEKAIRRFTEIVDDHHDEPEIQDLARVLVNASEKKQQEKQGTVLKSADDHYNMGIAELNRRELDSAVVHLQHALKLAPKGDHILYAMAAVHALQGRRDEALAFLKQSIVHRPENRFLAVRDADFEMFVEDADFRQLVTSPEK